MSVTSLRARLGALLGAPRTGPAEAAAFEQYASEWSLVLCRGLLLFVLATMLVWWPFDYWMQKGDPVLVRAISTWRLAILGTSVPALWLFYRRREFARDHIYLIVAVLLTLDTGLLAWSFSPLGGLATPWFYTTLPTPFATIAVLVPLWRRTLLVLAVVLASALGAFGPHPENLEHRMLGTALVTLFYLAALAVAAGHVIYLLVRRNFSQRQDLARRALELEAMDRAKSRFFANVSHELRTPLTLILAGLRRWRERTPAGDDQRVAHAAVRSGSRLLILVDELLDLARYDAGRSQPRKGPCDVAALAREVGAAFGVEQDLRVRAPEGALWAQLDVEQVRRALYNLVANARKYTPPVGRDISLECEDAGEHVILRVRDNGPGIPAGDRERVFEPFTRLSEGAAAPGWGVGLALVRSVAAIHGGRVHVESNEPHGAVFVLRLPKGEVSAHPASSVEPERFASDAAWLALAKEAAGRPSAPVAATANVREARPRVVVVEDHDDLRAHIAAVLAPEWDVSAHASALTALAELRARPPSVVVTDLMMPGMTGQELLDEIRGDPALTELPVLVLTAQAAAEPRAKALRSGATDYLVKPFDELELSLRVRNAHAAHARVVRLKSDNTALAQSNTTLEERLAAQLDEVRRLADHMDALREEERRRIARELHDELGQTLTAMRLDADRCEATVGTDPERALRALVHVSKGIDALLSHVRRIVADMRPQVLDDLGLDAAVRWLCATSDGRAGVSVQADLEEGCAERLRPEQQCALYRIVQEALTNVQRHSKAKRALVRLCRDADDVLLEVSDDGVGLAAGEGARRGSIGGGFGLLGMRERARAAGGVFRLLSREPGTRVEVRLPVPAGEGEGSGVSA